MYSLLLKTIDQIPFQSIDNERKVVLQPLVDFVQQSMDKKQQVIINFICTHNSRRSHLTQIWAQVAASYFAIPNVNCYSGGTEVTAIHPMVVRVLSNQGFSVSPISEGINPIYVIKYAENGLPILGFSKEYNAPFNPQSGFAAVLTCSQADTGCPFISGADIRIPITYKDPKEADGKNNQEQVYSDRSLEIARDMFYVFSQIKK